MARPTPYRDLNRLLEEFVGRSRGVLENNLVGVYLQGSFARGDADVHSDVDFIVVTVGEISSDRLAALQEMHASLYALKTPWAQHLEGSYFPESRIRRIDPTRASLLYLDNGASRLEWDNHCNTAIVRWTLREHGIVLVGPNTTTLIEPITAGELRADLREAIPDCVAYARGSLDPGEETPAMSRWKQQFLVQWFCRALHTAETGVVNSKKQACEWALHALDPDWRGLIQQALDDRPDPWARVHQKADDQLATHTLAFVAYAARRAKHVVREPDD